MDIEATTWCLVHVYFAFELPILVSGYIGPLQLRTSHVVLVDLHRDLLLTKAPVGVLSRDVVCPMRSMSRPWKNPVIIGGSDLETGMI